MRTWKKALSSLLVFSFLVTLLPTAVFAAWPPAGTNDTKNGEDNFTAKWGNQEVYIDKTVDASDNILGVVVYLPMNAIDNQNNTLVITEIGGGSNAVTTITDLDTYVYSDTDVLADGTTRYNIIDSNAFELNVTGGDATVVFTGKHPTDDYRDGSEDRLTVRDLDDETSITVTGDFGYAVKNITVSNATDLVVDEDTNTIEVTPANTKGELYTIDVEVEEADVYAELTIGTDTYPLYVEEGDVNNTAIFNAEYQLFVPVDAMTSAYTLSLVGGDVTYEVDQTSFTSLPVTGGMVGVKADAVNVDDNTDVKVVVLFASALYGVLITGDAEAATDVTVTIGTDENKVNTAEVKGEEYRVTDDGYFWRVRDNTEETVISATVKDISKYAVELAVEGDATGTLAGNVYTVKFADDVDGLAGITRVTATASLKDIEIVEDASGKFGDLEIDDLYVEEKVIAKDDGTFETEYAVYLPVDELAAENKVVEITIDDITYTADLAGVTYDEDGVAVVYAKDKDNNEVRVAVNAAPAFELDVELPKDVEDIKDVVDIKWDGAKAVNEDTVFATGKTAVLVLTYDGDVYDINVYLNDVLQKSFTPEIVPLAIGDTTAYYRLSGDAKINDLKIDIKPATDYPVVAKTATITVDSTKYKVPVTADVDSDGDPIYKINLPADAATGNVVVTIDDNNYNISVAGLNFNDDNVATAEAGRATKKVNFELTNMTMYVVDAIGTGTAKVTLGADVELDGIVFRPLGETIAITVNAAVGSYISNTAVSTGLTVTPATNLLSASIAGDKDEDGQLFTIDLIVNEVGKPGPSPATGTLKIGDNNYPNLYIDEKYDGIADFEYLVYLPTVSINEATAASLTVTDREDVTFTLNLKEVKDAEGNAKLTTKYTEPQRVEMKATGSEVTMEIDIVASIAFVVTIRGHEDGQVTFSEGGVDSDSDKQEEDIRDGIGTYWVVRDSDKPVDIVVKDNIKDYTAALRVNNKNEGTHYQIAKDDVEATLNTVAATYTADTKPGTGGSGSSGGTTYTITATAGENGSISPSGKVNVSSGNNRTFTITPNEGYEVDRVTVDGTSVGAVTTYTFEKVSKAHTIHATFKVEGSKTVNVSDFRDLDTSAWYMEAITYAVENSLFNGTSSTTFEPGTSMNRAMFITVLGRVAEQNGVTVSGTYSFTDIESGSYYEKYVGWANANNLVTGYSSTTFAPTNNVTREEMAVMLIRFATYMKVELKTDNAKTFTDADSVSEWAVDGVAAAAAAGIINGNDDGTFRPNNSSSRAEVAQVFYNFVSNYLAD